LACIKGAPVSKCYPLIVVALALLPLTACSTGQPSPPAGTSTTTSQAPGSVAQQAPTPPTVQAPLSATKQIPVPNGAPESTLAGTGIHIVSARSHVIDDVQLSPGQCHVKAVDAASGKLLPDPTCTPGAVDPGVTQSNLPQTICRSGYSSSVRAPATETDKAKTVSLAQYGEQSTKTTEYDHLISLELGGTNATSNLWPEPNAGQRHRDHQPQGLGGEPAARRPLFRPDHPGRRAEGHRHRLDHGAAIRPPLTQLPRSGMPGS
jgi:hypothetical protein